MSKCLGCGVTLQSKDANKEGFILENVKDKQICERCYRLTHYGEYKKIKNMDNLTILEKINKNSLFTFFLVDLININSEVLEIYEKIQTSKCLVISKIDYIPKDIKLDKIKNWLKDIYKIDEEIIFLSAKKNVNIHALEELMSLKNIKEAFLTGFTSSGKSTLIKILSKNKFITESYLPNTTIDFLKIKLDSGCTLVDAPGFQYQENLYDINQDFSKKSVIKNFIKPLTFQLKQNFKLSIENILTLENLSEKSNITFYISNSLKITRGYTKDYFNETFKIIDVKKDEDIVIKGLGFINVKNDCTFKIYECLNNLIEVRKSLF